MKTSKETDKKKPEIIDADAARIAFGNKAISGFKRIVHLNRNSACDKYDWQYSPFFIRIFYEIFY